jgi:Zn-dependent metalloprotease
MRKIIPLIVLMLLSAVFINAQNVSKEEDYVALQLISANKDAIGITADQISNAKVHTSYEDVATGIRYVGFQQSFKDIPVYNQFLILSFRRGALVSKAGFFDPNIEKSVNVASGSPAVSAESAVQSALSDRGFRATQPVIQINC